MDTLQSSTINKGTLSEKGEKGVDRILDVFEGMAPILKILLMLGTFTMNFWMGWALAGGHWLAGSILGTMAVCCDVSLIYFISRFKTVQKSAEKLIIFVFCMKLFALSLVSSVGFGLWIETLISSSAASELVAIDRKIARAEWRLEHLPGGEIANPNNAVAIGKELQALEDDRQSAKSGLIESIGYAPELAIFYKLPLFKSDPEWWSTFIRLSFGLCVTISPILIGCLGGGGGMRKRNEDAIPTLDDIVKKPRKKVYNAGKDVVQLRSA